MFAECLSQVLPLSLSFFAVFVVYICDVSLIPYHSWWLHCLVKPQWIQHGQVQSGKRSFHVSSSLKAQIFNHQYANYFLMLLSKHYSSIPVGMLLHPRDFVPLCVCAQLLSHVQIFLTPCTAACQAFCPWDFPGKNTAVGCHALLQGIFPTEGSKLHLLHLRQILYPLGHLGSLDEREGKEKAENRTSLVS